MKNFLRRVDWWTVSLWCFWLYWGVVCIGGLVFENSPVMQSISMWSVIIVMGTPFALIALLQVCVFVYNALFHGNPFYEEACTCHPARPHLYMRDGAPKRTNKKYCAVCKRETTCRLNRSPVTGQWIHVLGK